MKNNAYWSRRANLRMEEYHKNSDSTIQKISAAYDKAIKDINEDINKIFYKYQLDSGLSTTEVRELLNSEIPKRELDSIRKRIYNIQDEELKRYMMAQLNANAYKARITRLEALKESIYINSKIAADVEINQSTKLYTDNIKRAYYSNAFDIQKGLGVGFNIAEMPIETIQEIIKNNWSGKHYSKRVWHNTDVLAKQLEEVIASGLMSGKSSRRMAQELQDLTDYGKFACERLIRTETTYVTNMAELESYKECDINKYIFVTKLYTDNIKRAYYSNAFDIQKGLGVGFNIAEMPIETIQEIIKNNWSGKHYSKRVWHNTDVLAKQLEEVIASGLMSGKSSRRMAQELQDLTDYGKFACERLIRTETTYVTNMAELESYKECDINKYIFVATLDLRTSSVCREHDREVYEVEKAEVGVNLPPLHPHCRSTTRAYLGESTLNDIKRRARDYNKGLLRRKYFK